MGRSSSCYFKGRLLKVYTKRVRLPNGFVADIDVVKHIGAVLVVPFLSKDKVVFIRQYRPVIKEYLYELPAGTLSKKESLVNCAQRELVEETGFSAKMIKHLGAIVPVPGYSTEKIEIFKAEKLTKVGRQSEKDEVIEVTVFTSAEVKKLFRLGQLVDAKTICALAKVGWL
ncbi:MAG: NUDIX hydrolase [Candidatus Omnitrophica bacterium]|nr:NUDIX hydrolase [Candidatus Omnitrophota bacterium]